MHTGLIRVTSKRCVIDGKLINQIRRDPSLRDLVGVGVFEAT